MNHYQQRTLEIIMLHTAQNPIQGKSLAQAIGLAERPTGKEGADIRSIINSLRKSGFPVCANAYGYFCPETKQELSDYIRQLKSRIEKQQEAVDGLRKGFSKIGVPLVEIKKVRTKRIGKDTLKNTITIKE